MGGVTGDGVPDLIIGANTEEVDGSYGMGAAYALLMRANGSALSSTRCAVGVRRWEVGGGRRWAVGGRP